MREREREGESAPKERAIERERERQALDIAYRLGRAREKGEVFLFKRNGTRRDIIVASREVKGTKHAHDRFGLRFNS